MEAARAIRNTLCEKNVGHFKPIEMKKIILKYQLLPIFLNGPPARGAPGKWLQITVCPHEMVGQDCRFQVETRCRAPVKKHRVPEKLKLAEDTAPLPGGRPVRLGLPFAGNYLHVPETGTYYRQKTESSYAESVPDMRYPAKETKVRCREPAEANDVTAGKWFSQIKKTSVRQCNPFITRMRQKKCFAEKNELPAERDKSRQNSIKFCKKVEI